MPRLVGSERILALQLARYLQVQHPGVIYRYDLASDLKLTIGQATRHKQLHPHRGFPDLFVYEPRGIYKGLGIELKKDGVKLKKKDGSWATPHIAEQAAVLEALRLRGYKAEFAVGFEQSRELIDGYLCDSP